MTGQDLPHGRTLGDTDRTFSDDDGTADPAVRQVLSAAEGGDTRAYLDAVVELCGSRLLVPIMASGDHLDATGPEPDRHAEMAAVLLQRPDGEKAMVAFTGVDSMSAWQPDARPIPATLDKVCEAAVQSGANTVLIDLQGPFPFVIADEINQQLAQSRRLVKTTDGGYGWWQANPRGQSDAEPPASEA
ncbi:SseB family protein [Enemella sp. A6]|uniref:SseB family protein n=1 Tax=Enemella sp. A6 TaxID=3440152 RepID=UPI003EBC6BB4